MESSKRGIEKVYRHIIEYQNEAERLKKIYKLYQCYLHVQEFLLWVTEFIAARLYYYKKLLDYYFQEEEEDSFFVFKKKKGKERDLPRLFPITPLLNTC